MLDIPFALETIPAQDVDQGLARLSREQPNHVPILLGDADVFSTEWAESVDVFDPPKHLLSEANEIDIDAWFAARTPTVQASRQESLLSRASPLRLLSQSPDPVDPMVTMLRNQLAVLEAAGDGTTAEFDDIRQIIADIEADGTAIFPDPVDYITPRRGSDLAAGMVEAREPWEAAAWLQHGTYAICTPKPVLVALCKWLWDTHQGRIITASADSIGFQMDQPIETAEAAQTVLQRFTALGASEINADRRDTDGASLIGAPRLWVWWD